MHTRATTLGLVLWLAAAACSSPPPKTPPATSTETTMSTSAPATPSPAIRLECRRGPVPAAPGQSPEVARIVELDSAGHARRTVVRLDGARETADVPLTLDQLAALRRDAVALHAHGPLPTEAAVPDGVACVLRVELGGAQEWSVSYPTAATAARPLLDALIPLLDRG